jgi:hypothetical protein
MAEVRRSEISFHIKGKFLRYSTEFSSFDFHFISLADLLSIKEVLMTTSNQLLSPYTVALRLR